MHLVLLLVMTVEAQQKQQTGKTSSSYFLEIPQAMEAAREEVALAVALLRSAIRRLQMFDQSRGDYFG